MCVVHLLFSSASLRTSQKTEVKPCTLISLKFNLANNNPNSELQHEARSTGMTSFRELRKPASGAKYSFIHGILNSEREKSKQRTRFVFR